MLDIFVRNGVHDIGEVAAKYIAHSQQNIETNIFIP